jgi:branched-chain amino acid transport system substrate-binding protein
MPRVFRSLLLPVLPALLFLAAQCNADHPPLPSTSTTPTLRVAILSPTSGELAPVGQMMRNGVIMAFDEWNRQGGIKDRQFEWALYHTDCSFSSARQATRQAVDDGIDFIIGPICSEAAIAAATAVESAQVVILAPAATHPLVTVDGQGRTRPDSFRVSYTYALQAQAAAKLAYNTLEARQVALLSEAGSDYSSELSAAFSEQFVAVGGQVVYQTPISAGETELTDILTNVIQSGATLIYLPVSPAVANRVANQLTDLGAIKRTLSSERPGLALLGSDAWASEALDLVAVEGSYFPVHYSAQVKQPLVQNWRELYKSVFALEPDTLAALGYDTANLLAAAIEQADSFEPLAVTQVLEQSSFQGVTGQIKFDQFHDPIKPVPFVRVQNGRIRLITSIF